MTTKHFVFFSALIVVALWFGYASGFHAAKSEQPSRLTWIRGQEPVIRYRQMIKLRSNHSQNHIEDVTLVLNLTNEFRTSDSLWQKRYNYP